MTLFAQQRGAMTWLVNHHWVNLDFIDPKNRIYQESIKKSEFFNIESKTQFRSFHQKYTGKFICEGKKLELKSGSIVRIEWTEV